MAKNLGKLPLTTHQTVKALRRLAQDPITEIQEAAYQSLECISPFIEDLSETSVQSTDLVHYPFEFDYRLPDLLEILKDWRNSLPQQYDHHAPEELWALDQALSLLILTLEKNGIYQQAETSQKKRSK